MTSLPLTCSDSEYADFIKKAADALIVGVDTETSGEEIRDGRGYCMGVSIAFENVDGSISSAYFPFRHQFGTNYSSTRLFQLRTLLENHSGALVFHNAKHDLVSLETLGIKVKGKWYCTLMIAHFVDENILNKKLDSLAKQFLDDPGKKMTDKMRSIIDFLGWDHLPSEETEEYGAYDAVLALRLFYFFLPKFAGEGFADEVWDNEARRAKMLIHMERNGIRIDKEICHREIAKGEAKMAEITKSLGLNPGSPRQLEKLLIDEMGLPVFVRTPNGQPSFNKKAMERYEAILENSGDERAKQVLEYRGWQIVIGLCYKPYLEMVSPDGRLRPNYKLHGTKTGRLSCEKPNLQQIPRTGDKPWSGSLKSAFIPADGFTLIDIDFSQVEFRLAAAYSKDQNLISIFDSDEDIFTAMAAELGMKRQDVKTLVYTTLFGGGETRISDVFNVSKEEARSIRNHFFSIYPGLRRVANQVDAKAKSVGYIKMWHGRRRHCPDPRDSYKMFNSLIQGGAAEIVTRAGLRCYDLVKDDPNCRMLLTVHDSFVFEIKTEYVNEYVPQLVKQMEATDTDFGVTFKVEAKVWGE